MALPVRTIPKDVRDIVGYLKNKATGATIAEAQAVVKKTLLDPRKLNAYVAWNVVSREGERLNLTPRGRELGRAKDDGSTVFAQIIDSVVQYRSALEWIHHQGLDAVTNVDVASHWHEHYPEVVGDNETTIKDSATTFFHLCDAAGLGKLILGRKGSPTRLTIDKSAVREHVEAGPSAPPWVEPTTDESESEAASEAEEDQGTEEEPEEPPETPPALPSAAAQKPRVFISHGRDSGMVEQVETMLGLADMAAEVAEKEETAAIPVPEKVFAAMRRCSAGIIVVAVDERHKDAEGNYALNDNVLIEIGAAFVLYDRRVVLLWDKRLSVPSNLQGLYRCEFEGDELSWGAGMKLMKAIQDFKLPAKTAPPA